MTRTPSSQPLARTPLAAAILGVTLALPLGLITPLPGSDGQAHAESRMQTYSIPAGALGSALALFANEAGVVLSFDAALTNGKRSPGLQGRYSVEQGFSRLLAGTGLQALAGQGGNFSLVPAVEAGEALELSSVAISGKAQGATTEGSGSYTTAAVTIGKSTQSLRETPQSVTVMTRQVMDDKNLNTLDQVLSKTPGLSFTQRNFGSHRYQSRGFDIDDEAYMMDGIPGQAYNMTGWMPTDMAIYDRVEVLRGAAGLLVGAGGPGGAINLVRKRPTAEPQFSITTRAGSWDNYRLDLDGSSRLNDAGTLRGRFVAAYEDKGSYLDGLDAKTPLLYGIIEADLADDTTLTLSVRRQRTEIRGYTIFNLPRYSNGQSLDISRSTSLTQDWNKHETELDEVFTELSHRLNDDWTLKTSLTHSEGGFNQALAYARGAVNPATQAGSTFRSVEFRNTSTNSSGIDSFLEGHFDAFGRSHQVMVGANWSKQEITEKRAPVSINVPIDIFDVDRHAFAKPARPAWSVISDYVDTRAGVYANTRLRLSEPLSLVLGARVSWYKYEFDNRFGSGDYVARQNRQVTPFAGLIYDIDQNWSWYASYADIFKPQSNQRNVGGSFLDPAVGTNYETGIKGELLDKRLNVSLALFYTKREDFAIEDKPNSGNCPSNDTWGTCYISDGVQRSKGVDVEASGEVLPGLEVLAGYTYNRTSSRADTTMSIDTPRHLARVSTSYTLPGNWSRLTLGAGVSAQSGYVNETTQGDEYGSPGRAILDARASWKLDEHWKVSLTGENLTDRKYYATAVGTDRGNIFGDPRSYMLTLRGDF